MDIAARIKELKKKRNAVLLVHNYQLPEVQDLADFTGDSLGLSIQASKTKADVIVFCGVYFMAETAKILSPQKTVMIPEKNAGCPMADMITVDQLRALKKEHPKAKVLCYVNTSAGVKAECDVCCTSANAVEVIKEAFDPNDEIIFVPDKYLGMYAQSQTGRRLILWNGYCPIHVGILPEHVRQQKALHPKAVVMVHPECTPEVIKLADEVLSTSGMLRSVRKSQAQEFIIGTEAGIIYGLEKENPGRRFYAASDMTVCANMKKTTLAKVLNALEHMTHEVILPPDIVQKAQKSIQAMIVVREKPRPVLRDA